VMKSGVCIMWMAVLYETKGRWVSLLSYNVKVGYQYLTINTC